MRAYANYWANPGSQQFDRYTFPQYQANIVRKEQAELTDLPPWLQFQPNKSERILTVPVMKQGMTPILVTGDRDRNKVQVMSGGAYVTIPIELPENWDELMEELGYSPLRSFYL